jgi:DNA polymerase III delta subunit
VPRLRQDAIERALARLSPGLLRRLLQRCAGIDRAIKGQGSGDPWHGLSVLADALARGVTGGRARP